MDEKSLKSLEDSLTVSKYAPKRNDEPSIDQIVEEIETDVHMLNEKLALFKARLKDQVDLLNKASNLIMDLNRTTVKLATNIAMSKSSRQRRVGF